MHYHKPNKIKPMDNPYHKSTATITTDTKSRIFLLNQRSKVILSDSSDEQQVNRQLNNKPTLNKKSLTYKQSLKYNENQHKHCQNKSSSTNRQKLQVNIQLPIQQQMNFNESGFGTSPIFNNLSNTTQKPLLVQAKQISESRSSLIDKIKQQTFMQSRLIKPQSQFIHTTHKKRKKIFDSQAQRHIKKIKYYQQQIIKKQKQQAQQQQSYKLKLKTSRQNRQRQNKIQQKQVKNVPQIIRQNNGCPHTQCLIKSIDIIDKLTQTKITKQKTNINKVILQINLQMNMLHSIPIQQINQQNNRIKIKWANIATQQLVVRIKEEDNIDQKICDEIQNLCEKVNYFEIVREKYTYWRKKLQSLQKIIQDILLLGRQKKLQKLCIVQNELSCLEKSKIFENKNKYALIENYNNFVERQIKLLKKTYQWIRQKHF